MLLKFLFYLQVKVPDPNTQIRLEAAEERSDNLQKENASLQTNMDGLMKDFSELKSQLSSLEAKVVVFIFNIF